MRTDTIDFALRQPMAGDALPIAELIGDWEVVRWLSTPPYPYVLADAVEFVGKASRHPWGPPYRTEVIEIDGRPAGIIGIDPRKNGPNLGFWLGRPYWGRGIMTRAALQLTRDFFANSDEGRLNSGYFSGNVASMSIQRRLGFATSGEGLLFSRPQGQRLPHVETVLTRARFEGMHRSPNFCD